MIMEYENMNWVMIARTSSLFPCWCLVFCSAAVLAPYIPWDEILSAVWGSVDCLRKKEMRRQVKVDGRWSYWLLVRVSNTISIYIHCLTS